MTKEELAEQFAEQKAEELTSMLKEAYLKGYEQGTLNANQTFSIDGFTVVDLGLPSGTMWTKEPLCILHYGYKQERLSYQEAAKLPIPTEEQWDEVCRYCRFENDKIIGPSGERIGYGWAPAGYRIYNLGEGCEEGQNMFWLKGEVDTENTAPTMLYDIKREDEMEFIYSHIKGTSRHFTGFKLPVFLVKNKE